MDGPEFTVERLVSTNRYHGPFRPVPSGESDQLDALRGLSAVGVAIGHANQLIIAPTNTFGITIFGLIAQGSVMMFFVLSGLLICKSITRNIEQNGGERFDLGKYARDRLWRIYPPLIFAIALMCLIWLVAPFVLPSGTTQFLHPTPDYGRHGINLQWKSIVATLGFANGFVVGSPDMNGPLWSLSVEVWYYVVAAGIVALIRKPILLMSFLAVGWFGLRRNADFTDFAVVWFAGYGLAMMHNQGALRVRWVLAGLIASLIAALSFAIMFALAQAGPNWIRLYNVAIGFAFAFLLAAICCGRAKVPTWLTASFRGAARYSYTLYLIHMPIYLLIFGILEPYIVGNLVASLLTAAGAFAIALGLATIVAKVLENKRILQQSMRLRLTTPTS